MRYKSSIFLYEHHPVVQDMADMQIASSLISLKQKGFFKFILKKKILKNGEKR